MLNIKYLKYCTFSLFLLIPHQGFAKTIQDAHCRAHEELQCSKLNMGDGHCKRERDALIDQRYIVLNDPSEHNKIIEYKLLLPYKKCIDLKAQIEPKTLLLPKKIRKEAAIHSAEEKHRLAFELQEAQTPEGLYFRWQYFKDRSALKQFLALSGTPEVETVELQQALGNHHSRRKPNEAIEHLLHALELVERKQAFDNTILSGLSTIYLKRKNMEQSYLWAIVATQYDAPMAPKERLIKMYQLSEDKAEQLDDIANDIKSALSKGEFSKDLTIVPELEE